MELVHPGTGTTQPSIHGDVAIIGMACMYPGAPNLAAYWHNIVHKVDAITDPPPDAWDADIFFDPDSASNDRVYCKRGGYLSPLAEFNPLDYGIMPVGLEGGEPDQWLALKVAQDALADAGYLERLKTNEDERHRTAVILGKGTYLNRGNLNMVQHSLVVDQTLQALRMLHPEYDEDELRLIRQELKRKLPPFNAEAAPGLVPNIVAGRIANRLDLMGPSYTVDAACASSLIAIDIAMRELLIYQCDLALVGGVQVTTPIPILTLFCQLNALSRRQEIRPFDSQADGTILGEGVGIVVLKRREDATRDGDRIYAFVKGVGTSSDGRAMGVLAPRVEGEELALQRAYQLSGVSPETIGLIEAHGTGTPVGDLAEVQALHRLFARREGQLPHCALGSVKSMIGHTMPAAGVAGVIKTALSLYHKVLPPTLHCDEPHPRLELEKSSIYVNTETRPWIHGISGKHSPRRAGVNAFGFGGINAHAILEENQDQDEAAAPSHLRRWDSEVVVLAADTRAQLIERARDLGVYLEASPEVELLDLAYTLNTESGDKPYRVSMVAESPLDMRQKLARALPRLADPNCHQIKDIKGIYFFERPFYPQGKLAFLFPGEGAQYPNMLADLCLHFPEVRACFDRVDGIFVGHRRSYLPSDFIFPRPTSAGRGEIEQHLWRADGAIEAVLTANQALLALLGALGIRPDAVVGHSTGEYSAMRAAGVIPLSDEEFVGKHLLDLNRTYSEQVAHETDVPRAVLLAVGAGLDQVEAIVRQVEGGLYIGMDNCPHQTVIVGEKAAVDAAQELMRSRGLICEKLAFDRAYHTPLFAPYSQTIRGFFERLPLTSPHTRLYSCTTAGPYPDTSAEIRALALEHWARPVRFRETIQAMYADGVRLFVEVGPRGNLTAFVDDTLGQEPHLAIPADLQHRSGLSQLNHLLGLLSAQGVSVRWDHIYRRRWPRTLSLESTGKQAPGGNEVGGTVKLATGWAGMEISPEAAAQLRNRVSQPRSPANPAGELGTTSTPNQRLAVAGVQPDAVPTKSGSLASPGDQAFGDPRARVMQAHLQLMEQFLDAQQAVMQQFVADSRVPHPVPESAGTEALAGEPEQQSTAVEAFTAESGPTQPAKASIPDSAPAAMARSVLQPMAAEMPFIRTIVSLAPGQELLALCKLDLSEDLFLRDHTLGRFISEEDPDLPALPIVPLTVSMEIMAEAAAALVPDQVVIGMRNVRAYRWILVEDESLTLRVAARRKSAPAADQVEVYLREAGDEAAKHATPIMEGTLILGRAYPEAPKVAPIPLRAERPSRWAPQQLYTEGMFHGPDFQAVASVDRTGDDGAVATLQSLPPHQLFRSKRDPAFVADPIFLDAAGQLIGFWTMEHLETGFVVFPFRCEAVNIFGAPLPAGQKAICQARIALVEGGHVSSNIDISGPDGRLRLQLVGWEDRRFDLPRRFYRFVLSPRETLIGEDWTAPLQGFERAGGLQCCRVSGLPAGLLEAHGGFWETALAHLVLSRAEREVWRRLTGPKRRRVDWLLGRVAAKDAVRRLVRSVHGAALCPADIEIVADRRGRPMVQGAGLERLRQPILISLAHTDGAAVALAGLGGNRQPLDGVGIDVERANRPSRDFEGVAFTPSELAQLAAMDPDEGESWPLRLWCAKEAVGKALGHGLASGPHNIVAKEINPRSGVVKMSLAGEMARLFPAVNGASLTAHTARDGDLVVASALKWSTAEERNA